MPSDIRSFFGGAPAAAASQESKTSKKSTGTSKARGRARVVLDESDDELPSQPKTITRKTRAQRDPTPEGEDTTTSEFFGSKKPHRSEPVRNSKKAEQTPQASPSKATRSSKNSTPKANGTPGERSSARQKKVVNYNEDDMQQKSNGEADVQSSIRTGQSKQDMDEPTDEDELEVIQPKPTIANNKTRKSIVKHEEDDFEPTQDTRMQGVEAFEATDDLDDGPPMKAMRREGASKAGSKRKSPELDDAERPSSKNKPKSTVKETQSPAKKRAKKEEATDSKEMQAIFDSIPLVRPPTPPQRDGQTSTFKFGQGHANSGPPPAEGAKEIPTGADNCLAGLSFVFTGLLESLSREAGQSLVKRYGGKVQSAPSSKTNWVVLGSDAGPKKLETIAKNNLKTINEEGLFELIRKLPANGGDSKAAEKFNEKKEAELEKVKQMAAEMDKDEKTARAQTTKASTGAVATSEAKGNPTTTGPDNRLWTVKYAPTQLSHICGNKTQVEKLQRWLRMFQKNLKKGFKLAGADGSGVYRAVLIHGPPGIGKTTAAHLVARMEGYDVLETNASDTRSKKLVEAGLKGVLSSTSLMGYFSGDGKQVETSKKKLALVMDEVDGMSAGDRGGVSALATVCKKTEIPIILICNDRRSPKMKPFDHVTYDVPFRRPTVEQIRSRIMTIGFREGLKLPTNVIDALIEGSGADIRQVVNMVSTAKLDQSVGEKSQMDYDKSKQMSKAWEKHIVLKPWDIVGKILGGGMFASSSNATLNDKIELYFNDHEFSYLMLQENYLNTSPIAANQYSGRQRSLMQLELMERAASSISEGDLVDRMIHGPQQHWSLMPTHAAFSFVRPASFVAGSMAGNRTGFTQWLGKNSNQQKLTRMVKEIQGHMRLRASGDRHEIRQQYIPLLWAKLPKRLEVEGKDAAQAVIDLMDQYYLTKDDFDAIIELGVGPMLQGKENLEIPSQAKAAFTRMYNEQSHPLPFVKASNVAVPKSAAKEKPDLEEALEESDAGEALEDAKEDAEDEDVDISKDKYIKQPKKKKTPTAKAGAASKPKAKGKKAKAEEDEEMDDFIDDDEAPKKKGKATTKGKAKK